MSEVSQSLVSLFQAARGLDDPDVLLLLLGEGSEFLCSVPLTVTICPPSRLREETTRWGSSLERSSLVNLFFLIA
jgi:hypothetical protein